MRLRRKHDEKRAPEWAVTEQETKASSKGLNGRHHTVTLTNVFCWKAHHFHWAIPSRLKIKRDTIEIIAELGKCHLSREQFIMR